MHFLSRKVAGFIVLLAGCSSGTGEPAQALRTPQRAVRHDIKGLGQLVNLSGWEVDSSQKVCWAVNRMGGEAQNVPGPTDYYLLAYFKLKAVDSSKFTVINTLTQPLKKTEIYYQPWLPNNVAYLFKEEASGSKTFVYDARVLAKASYTHGFFCVSKDKDVYLFMNTQ